MIGTKLAHYEITNHLGTGGMGEVYQATDSKLGRNVAIKLLPAAFASDPERLSRFRREAQLLASLNHPNIAHIYGLEESADTRCIVMELIEGETLQSRIKSGKIPVDEALTIAKQIAEALEAAHEKGVIHRDLKPGNVMLTSDGRVKVLDFGLAKAYDANPGSATSSNSPTMASMAATNAGVILGTAAYMSPEQARGKTVDKRADIWAFGAVFFEMLTGQRAFPGEDLTDTLANVLKLEPAWEQLAAALPARIRQVIRACLQKNPKQRIGDAQDVRLALEGAFETATSPALAPAPEPRSMSSGARGLALLAAGVLAGALLTAAALSFWGGRAPAPTIVRFPFTLPDGQQFTNTGRQLVSIAPDGSQFVYVANYRLYLKPMRELSSIPIPGTEIPSGILNPVFSPDSRSVAFYANSDRALKRISVSGGAAVIIGTMDPPFGMSWGPDNEILIGQGNKGIARVSANGGKPETIINVKPTEAAQGPQMLPGTDVVLFTLATGINADRWDKAQIVTQNLKSGERKILVEGGSDARYVSTGHLIYSLAGTLLAEPFDVKRLAVTGGPVPVIEGVRGAGNNTGTSHFSISDSGSLVYVPGTASGELEKSTLALVDRNGNSKPLALPPAPYWHPRISPNGKQLAVHTDDGKDQIIWIYDLDGKTSLRRLTFAGKNFDPIWSADSQRVLFESNREGDEGIFWQRADGTGVAERVTKPEGEWQYNRPDMVSPDGQTILFTAGRPGDASIWTYSMRDKKASLFADAPSWQQDSSFSPDGHWVAYLSEEAGRNVIVEPFPATGAKYLITKNGGTHPNWSPDGKELFFMNEMTNGQLYSVSIHTQPSFTFGNPVALPIKGFSQRAGSWRDYEITPDGKQFLVMLPPGAATNEAPQTLQVQVVLNWFEELKQRMSGK